MTSQLDNQDVSDTEIVGNVYQLLTGFRHKWNLGTYNFSQKHSIAGASFSDFKNVDLTSGWVLKSMYGGYLVYGKEHHIWLNKVW